jgi:TonB family protein
MTIPLDSTEGLKPVNAKVEAVTYKEARKAGFEGTVRVNATMTADGTLTNLTIVKSPGLGLDDSVLKTLKKWKCTPPQKMENMYRRRFNSTLSSN